VTEEQFACFQANVDYMQAAIVARQNDEGSQAYDLDYRQDTACQSLLLLSSDSILFSGSDLHSWEPSMTMSVIRGRSAARHCNCKSAPKWAPCENEDPCSS
jgi:hypothetical protein